MNCWNIFNLKTEEKRHNKLELSNLYELGIDEIELVNNRELLQEKWANYEYMTLNE